MSNLIDKLEEILINDKSKETEEIFNIFTDYFGEEFVDCKVNNNDNIISHLLSYGTVHRLLRAHCLIDEHSDGEINLIYTGGNGNYQYIWSKEKFEEFKDKELDDFPEELLPLINIICESYTRDNYNTVIIRFPEVTVTNENNKSIKIQELYAKVIFNNMGKMSGRFELIRSHYPLEQWLADYCHSHISHISIDWLEPCTGTGPINSTMASLRQEYSAERWGLFCYELDKFVKVESLAGVPYRRLETVGALRQSPVSYRNANYNYRIPIDIISTDLQKDFLRTFVKEEEIKISYRNGSYQVGDTFENFWIKISRVFAQWYNKKYKDNEVMATLKELLSKNIVDEYVIKEGRVYGLRAHSTYRVHQLQGTFLFDFKDHPVNLDIETELKSIRSNVTYLLNLSFVVQSLRVMLLIINYNYGRQETTEEIESKRRKIYI